MLIETFTGVSFNVKEPDIKSIRIIDIAHSLGMQCRFNGQCNRFYSVAEHCCLMYDYMRAPWCLMHDAAEAYIGDIVTDVKHESQCDLEDEILKLIAERHGMCWPIPKEIKKLDYDFCNTEACLLGFQFGFSRTTLKNVMLGFWNPEQAKSEFLRRYQLCFEPSK